MLQDIINITDDIFVDSLPAEEVYNVLSGEDDYCVCDESDNELLIEI